ncbi:hypothetical protein PILCRDRAFT_702990 [Piloderma croceum F 1598]|uniref:F-box domain-containing protein n=1 Tax=Piloderma croceum (strain F 1598) TaxID=765440 RepID=A0A0C3AKN7_PILCF|nr:hypothetical protein PILCRDRAFT_702990 [Piloderma croceum F 1598]
MSAPAFAFTFPLDVERLIFEEAARNDIQSAVQLALVCRRVQSWVEPIIYKIVSLHSIEIRDSFRRSLEITTKPLSFYVRYIKVLDLPRASDFWRSHPQTTIKLFACCKGVEHFVSSASPFSTPISTELLEAVTAMRPRRLVGRLTRILPDTNPNFSLPFFNNVTHLQISDSMDRWATWSGFHHLRRLSHILLPASDDFGVSFFTPGALRVVKDILSHCESLQVCVLRHGNTTDFWYRPGEALDLFEGTEDARVVFILTPVEKRSDWQAFFNGEPDTWDYADQVVAMQRQTGRRVKARRVIVMTSISCICPPTHCS